LKKETYADASKSPPEKKNRRVPVDAAKCGWGVATWP
jgi:hypothetical protein